MNHAAMLLALGLTTVLSAFGVWAIVKAMAHVVRVLRIDVLGALLWLGLAERPVVRQRRRLGELLAEAP